MTDPTYPYPTKVINTDGKPYVPTPSAPIANPQTREFDYAGGVNIVYMGVAAPGSSTGAAVWSICKFTYDGSGNMLTQLWAGGSGSFVNIWNSRASLMYS